MSARLRMDYHERHLRPGGTISGPAMFALTDLALYVAILAQIGPVALAVTTNLNINFMRKPEPRAMIGECRLLKLGRRIAVGEVLAVQRGIDRSRRPRGRLLFDPAGAVNHTVLKYLTHRVSRAFSGLFARPSA
jgi:uncharacterized protein (TIGR00369 family)